MSSVEVEAAVAALADDATDLASVLYDLDADPALTLLGDPDRYRGATALAVAEVAGDIDLLWPAWTAIRDVADRASEATAARRHADAAELLATPVEVADLADRRPPAELARWLRGVVAEVTRVGHRLAEAWSEAATSVDNARATIGRVEEQAAAVGASDAGVIRVARAVLTSAVAELAADPVGLDTTELTAAVADARAHVADLSGRRDALPGRLNAATSLVEQVHDLVPRGRDALRDTRERIADPPGLLEPLDLTVLTDERHGLVPWLARITAAADRGDWEAALAGLDRWEQVASPTLANARRIATANAAPVARRDELRGLLGALRAKAAAVGLAEDPATTQLHDAARQLLYVAPCPLAEAERRVDAYRDHVTHRPPAGAPTAPAAPARGDRA